MSVYAGNVRHRDTKPAKTRRQTDHFTLKVIEVATEQRRKEV